MRARVEFPSKYSIVTSGFNIKGYILFEQLSINDPVMVTVELINLPNGLHGFHIHEKGLTDIILKNIDKSENICNKLGGHFNPYKTVHGSYALKTQRHAGDLINNLNVNNNKVSIKFLDNLICLFDSEINCILNKSIVIHETEDDQGIPGYNALINNKTTLTKKESESLITGNAGNRIACGNINLI